MRGAYGDDSNKGLFNNAAQDWNHSFFWKSMTPDGGGDPTGDLAARLAKDFGSIDAFREAFKQAAAPASSAVAGPGWSMTAAR